MFLRSVDYPLHLAGIWNLEFDLELMGGGRGRFGVLVAIPVGSGEWGAYYEVWLEHGTHRFTLPSPAPWVGNQVRIMIVNEWSNVLFWGTITSMSS